MRETVIDIFFSPTAYFQMQLLVSQHMVYLVLFFVFFYLADRVHLPQFTLMSLLLQCPSTHHSHEDKQGNKSFFYRLTLAQEHGIKILLY